MISVLVAGATLLYLLVEVVVRTPQLGLLLVGLVAVVSWHVPVWPSVASFAGLSFAVPDFLTVVLIASTLVYVLGRAQPKIDRNLKLAIDGLIVLLVVSVLKGIVQVGLASSLNESRAWIYIISISAWTVVFLKSDPNAIVWLRKGVLVTAAGITMVALLNVALNGFGGASTSSVSASGVVLEAGRPISSGQAMILAIAAILCIWCWSRLGNRSYFIGFLGFTVVVVLAQHRSVWIALAIGVVLSLLFLLKGQAAAVVGALVLIIGTALVSLVIFSDSRIAAILFESAADSRTYDGRVYDWQILIGASFDSGLHTVLTGFPFGSGWTRYREDGLRIGYIPHNWYVATYLRAGAFGLLFMVFVGAVLIQRGWKNRFTTPALAIAAMLVAYCWSYNLQWYLAPALGWLVWSMSRPNVVEKQCEMTGQSENAETLLTTVSEVSRAFGERHSVPHWKRYKLQ